MNDKEKIELCEATIIHRDTVEKVKDNIPAEEKFKQEAELYKILSDPTRLKILSALSVSEMCVCDIAALLNMKSSAISHQLRRLKNHKLVKSRKEGKVVYYSLNRKKAEEESKRTIKFLQNILN